MMGQGSGFTVPEGRNPSLLDSLQKLSKVFVGWDTGTGTMSHFSPSRKRVGQGTWNLVPSSVSRLSLNSVLGSLQGIRLPDKIRIKKKEGLMKL